MAKSKAETQKKSKATKKVAEAQNKKVLKAGKEFVDIEEYTMNGMTPEDVNEDLNRFRAGKNLKRGIGGFLTALMFIAGIGGLVLGSEMCIDTMQEMGNAVKITESEANQISQLNQQIINLTAERDALPEGDPTMIQLVGTHTTVNVDAQDALSRLAGMNGLSISNIESYERKNESDTLKAYYVYHGRGQVSGLLDFVEDVRNSDLIVLVEEVFITEPMQVNVGGEVQISSDIEFRVTFQHSYSQGDLEAIAGEYQGQIGIITPPEEPEVVPEMPSGSEDPECEHVFGEPGWVAGQLPTHDVDGFSVQVCEICNEVVEVMVPAGSAGVHNIPAGKCVGSVCESCGESISEHMFSPWSVVSEETCYSDGLKQRNCVIEGCNIVETLTIPMSDHKAIQGEDGSWTCESCGMSMTDPASENISIG